jgi:hypothetical protein
MDDLPGRAAGYNVYHIILKCAADLDKPAVKALMEAPSG